MATRAEFLVETKIQSDRSTPLRWIMSYVNQNWGVLIGMFVGAFGNAALAVVPPVLIGYAFDEANRTNPSLTVIGWLAVWIIISQAVRAFLQLGRNFASEVLGQRIERDTREELYVSLLGKSMTFHDSQPVGDTMARATNDVREMNLMFNPGINLVVGSANFLIVPFISIPYTYDWRLLLAPTFFIITYAWSLKRYMDTLRPIADSVRLTFGKMNSRLAEAIDGIEIVKSSASEDAEVNLFRQNATAYRDGVVAQGRVEARFLPLLLLGITSALGFTHALLLYREGAILLGDVVGYMGVLGLFGFPTFISLFAYSQVARGMAGARRVLELINTETDLDQNAGGVSNKIQGGVRFENVSFGYLPNVPILQNISFEVKAGQTVALVGQTGAGKTTLAKLINRTYDVQNGRVLVDGIDVREWDLAALRQQISIIEQDIFLFSRTIAENIAFGKQGATQEQIEAAAHAAQAHEFITTFADGYQTIVGERGVTLSGGQRQRLALARAFLSQPSILVLDDSTSAVDSATEDKIQKAISLAAANQTTILITHRLSQIRWADLVVVVRQGKLAAVGTHDELMANVPAYRRIFEQYQ
ncbi:MAG: ABC transporter ATP-binding protein [Chloroflexi bacterium]|nr:ABC transporter ATP-binding protein [Chloroflexota bacterium]